MYEEDLHINAAWAYFELGQLLHSHQELTEARLHYERALSGSQQWSMRDLGSAGWLLAVWTLAGVMTITSAALYGDLVARWVSARLS